MPEQPDLASLLHTAQVSLERLRQRLVSLINDEIDFLVSLGAAGVSSMPYRKAAILHDRILQPLESSDYERAAQELDDFLSEWPMDRIMPILANEVRPVLQLIVQRESEIARLRRLL